MGLYLYEHPETKEIKEIFQSIHDIHTYEEDGIKWDRVYTVPNFAIDTKIDPHSAADFVKATAKAGTLGELFDRSAELSEKRGGTTGQDEVKQKNYEDYSARRHGSLHPDLKRKRGKERLKKVCEKAGVTVTL